jgi:hypothetical protein
MYFQLFPKLQKSVKKIQVSLKPDKNNGYFTWKPMYILIISVQFFLEWKMFHTNIVEKNQNMQFIFKKLAVYEIMCKNIVELGSQ